MESDYKWITASCFFPVYKWHLLLQQINHFINRLIGKDMLFYQLAFNYVDSDNIRLAIAVPHNTYEEMIEKINAHFSSFFLLYPDEHIKQPINDIFLPLPTATIQFAFFSIVFNENDTENYKLQQHLSKTIIEALQHDQIDADTISTLLFYLQISLAHVYLTHHPNEAGSFMQYFTATTSDVDFGQNTNVLNEIASDLFTLGYFEEDLAVFNNWIAVSTHFFQLKQYEPQRFNAQPFETFYKTCVAFVHNQLSVTENVKEYVNQAIISHYVKYYSYNEGLIPVTDIKELH